MLSPVEIVLVPEDAQITARRAVEQTCHDGDDRQGVRVFFRYDTHDAQAIRVGGQ